MNAQFPSKLGMKTLHLLVCLFLEMLWPPHKLVQSKQTRASFWTARTSLQQHQHKPTPSLKKSKRHLYCLINRPWGNPVVSLGAPKGPPDNGGFLVGKSTSEIVMPRHHLIFREALWILMSSFRVSFSP